MLKETEQGIRVSVRTLAVLILILMEHAQRGVQMVACGVKYSVVLILILMEHAQRVSSK